MEPNFSLFGIPEVKPCIQCHSENQRESQVCVPATAVIKRPSLKAVNVTRITIVGNLPQGRNFYTINRLDIVLLPKYQRNSVSLAWLMVHITVIPCLCHLLMDFTRMSLSMLQIWFLALKKKKKKKKTLAYLKHSWKPHSF